MIVNDGSEVPGLADPMTGGYIEQMTVGLGFQQPPSSTAVESVTVGTAGATQSRGGMQVVWALVILIVGLVVLKFATEHSKADMDVAHVRISLWNWLAITLLAVTGSVTMKALLNQWPGPDSPLTQVFNAA